MLRPRVIVPATLLALTLGAVPASARPSAEPAEAVATKVSERFRAQQLKWQPCFPESAPGLPPGGERLQCSVMKAPLDWNKPDRGTVDLAVSRLRPEHGEPKNLLLTNPGGPGEEGTIVPLLFLDPRHAAVADSSEIVGVDVRGTGRSTNVTCGGETIGRERDVRDRGRTNENAMLDDAESMARACQTASKPVGDYVNTAQTVRDFDLLRSLLGHDRTNFFGFSAGTWLGAHYATAFPSRVGRFVFDSSVKFTGTWQQIYALQPMGFERRFRQDFLPWAARYDAVYGLGDSARAVRAVYERTRAQLAEQPLDMGDGTVVTATSFDSLIAGNLYNKAYFPQLGGILAGLDAATGGSTARSGDAGTSGAGTSGAGTKGAAGANGAKVKKDLAELVDGARGSAKMPGVPTGAPDAIDATFYTVGCNDTPWHGNRRTLAASSALQGKMFPLIGWRSIAEPCLFWDRPAVKLPKPDGKGLPPVLMVQSEHDPAAPMEGAKLASAGFAGSRLLTVEDEGDHMLYGNSNPCVDNAVDSYLASGKLPRRGTTCTGGPLPDPTAPEGARGEHSAERLSGFADKLPR
ncbi:alpha/beta hydrolase [Streptomyces iconiensis]|uniref:Alpha/beta hydrolase n=1 Tax=Streptomyces iconiensis TaxID=1384038 RepID=A0ABT7A4P6_9ACTN|nr:alpha/beta hydrolase [Streptomyces iconiensis]MDJ1135999.1 alpha/beta hydrolase [Streptomyces iconiensis]